MNGSPAFHARLGRVLHAANRAAALMSRMYGMAADWEMVPDGTNPCRTCQGVEKREENPEVEWRVAMKGRNEVF